MGCGQRHQERDKARLSDSGCGVNLQQPRTLRRSNRGEARYLLLGITSTGRRAALIFTRRGDKLRPISCRAMRKTEKEAYDATTT